VPGPRLQTPYDCIDVSQWNVIQKLCRSRTAWPVLYSLARCSSPTAASPQLLHARGLSRSSPTRPSSARRQAATPSLQSSPARQIESVPCHRLQQFVPQTSTAASSLSIQTLTLTSLRSFARDRERLSCSPTPPLPDIGPLLFVVLSGPPPLQPERLLSCAAWCFVRFLAQRTCIQPVLRRINNRVQNLCRFPLCFRRRRFQSCSISTPNPTSAAVSLPDHPSVNLFFLFLCSLQTLRAASHRRCPVTGCQKAGGALDSHPILAIVDKVLSRRPVPSSYQPGRHFDGAVSDACGFPLPFQSRCRSLTVF
jgi:hypothetical protein